MIAVFSTHWRYTWKEIWVKIDGTSQCPEDLFIQLFDVALDYLKDPPKGPLYDEIHNDPIKARRAFRLLKGDNFKNEFAVIDFLEESFQSVFTVSVPALANSYTKAVRSFIKCHNLAYRIDIPFRIQALLPGVFAELYENLGTMNASNPDLLDLMRDFEDAFDEYYRIRQANKLRDSISKACKYAEGVAGAVLQRSATLGSHCDHLDCWPHTAVKEALKKVYGFCSDYPGLRHSGSSGSRIRHLESRDAVFFSLLFMGFSAYCANVDTL